MSSNVVLASLRFLEVTKRSTYAPQEVGRYRQQPGSNALYGGHECALNQGFIPCLGGRSLPWLLVGIGVNVVILRRSVPYRAQDKDQRRQDTPAQAGNMLRRYGDRRASGIKIGPIT